MRRCIAIAGGGTAGHIYPALAIADTYKQFSGVVELLFIGTPQGLESRLVPQYGYRLVLVQGGPLFGVNIPGKLRSMQRLCVGMIQARQVLKAHDVKLVIGVGGYASAGALLAARSLGLGTAIFEANTVPGLANKLLGRVVDRVYLGFAVAGRAFPEGRKLVTGHPVRSPVITVSGEERRAPHNAGRPVHILVTGGSLGAPFLNQHVPDLLKQVADHGLAIEVRHQLGEFDPEPIRAAYARAGIPASLVSYIADMADAYRWADFAIARAGAGTIAELALSGLPTLLVPLPHAPGNHQVTNTIAFAEVGGGLWIHEREWQVPALAVSIASLLSNVEAWTTASTGVRRLATLDAAHKLVTDCEALMDGRW
jgi:UDP-N-acetylglucosamine--N-acetylmuramyl-(pentapeptide) pyrophosphoryl-undecaprenol N-acetylglucosamine transferase